MLDVGMMDVTFRISGIDLARGLMRIGFRLTGNADGYLLLEGASHAVTVPLLDEISAPLVRFLVTAAGVSLARLREALDAHSIPPPPARVSGTQFVVRQPEPARRSSTRDAA